MVDDGGEHNPPGHPVPGGLGALSVGALLALRGGAVFASVRRIAAGVACGAATGLNAALAGAGGVTCAGVAA